MDTAADCSPSRRGYQLSAFGYQRPGFCSGGGTPPGQPPGTAALRGQLHEFATYEAVLNNQFAHADGKFETPRSSAAGIEIENAIPRLLPGHVAVAGNDHGESRGFGLQIELRQVVQHVDRNSSYFEHVSFWQPARPGAFVDIATHHPQRGDAGKFVKNFRGANIPGMNDGVGAAQGCDGFRTQQAMRVGDDANEEGSSQFSVLSSQFSDFRLLTSYF